MNKNVVIKQIQVKDIMTKSNAPIGGYCVNPYVGCTHGCKYCYASFMKRFTGHTEEWGTFLDVKNWEPIKNLDKYKGEHIIIGTVTDGYLPQEAEYKNTRKLLEQLVGVDAELLICTKSDLVVRDLDLLEVSIIDDKKYPAYIGTSIEMRDDEVKIAEYRNADFSKIEIRDEPEQQPEKEVEKIDYSDYEERLKKAKERI